MVNSSPFILDDWEEEERILMNKPALLDLAQIDTSVHVTITLKVFKIIFH
jgi:hypothetical protein